MEPGKEDVAENNRELAISLEDRVEPGEVIALSSADGWSAADKPVELLAAMRIYAGNDH